MKYTFETDDDLEAKQLMTAKDALYALHEILNFSVDRTNVPLEHIYAILDKHGINLEILWP